MKKLSSPPIKNLEKKPCITFANLMKASFTCNFSYRTIEHVQAIATQAKLNPDDLANTSQCLYFAHELNPDNMALLQVEDGMVEHLHA